MADSTPAHRLRKGQRVRIEGPGVVLAVTDRGGETVEVAWRPYGEPREVTSPIPRDHPVKHAE